ncbi:MAG: HD-GYP domain-containing protein, partial [Motiliproteus sp.]
DDQTARNLLRITSHDFYTYTHSVNVGVTSLMVAKELFRGSDAHDLEELASGFFLHDLGKVMVRPEVINKPGRLDDAEMKHMRIHPYQGYKLLDAAGEMTEESRYIVMQHHERFDGSGYPKGLQNEDIHIYGRICCIADVFDALTADRSYKKAMSKFEALKLMKDQMSGHFDQKLFSEFVNLYRQ